MTFGSGVPCLIVWLILPVSLASCACNRVETGVDGIVGSKACTEDLMAVSRLEGKIHRIKQCVEEIWPKDLYCFATEPIPFPLGIEAPFRERAVLERIISGFEATRIRVSAFVDCTEFPCMMLVHGFDASRFFEFYHADSIRTFPGSLHRGQTTRLSSNDDTELTEAWLVFLAPSKLPSREIFARLEVRREQLAADALTSTRGKVSGFSRRQVGNTRLLVRASGDSQKAALDDQDICSPPTTQEKKLKNKMERVDTCLEDRSRPCLFDQLAFPDQLERHFYEPEHERRVSEALKASKIEPKQIRVECDEYPCLIALQSLSRGAVDKLLTADPLKPFRSAKKLSTRRICARMSESVGSQVVMFYPEDTPSKVEQAIRGRFRLRSDASLLKLEPCRPPEVGEDEAAKALRRDGYPKMNWPAFHKATDVP